MKMARRFFGEAYHLGVWCLQSTSIHSSIWFILHFWLVQWPHDLFLLINIHKYYILFPIFVGINSKILHSAPSSWLSKLGWILQPRFWNMSWIVSWSRGWTSSGFMPRRRLLAGKGVAQDFLSSKIPWLVNIGTYTSQLIGDYDNP